MSEDLLAEADESIDVFDKLVADNARLRAELDALRAARDELLDTDAFHARHCLVEQDNDRLRAEKVDLEYRLGLQVRDAIALQREVSALRARLVQTAGQVEVDRIAFEEICFNLRNCSQQEEAHVADSLKIARNVLAMRSALPEAPPVAGETRA